MVRREERKETRNKVLAIFMQQGFRDSDLKCVLREQGNLPGGCICLKVLYLDYTFIAGGMVSRWQLTAASVELKLLQVIPAFRCDERSSFPGPAGKRGSQRDGIKEEGLES